MSLPAELGRRIAGLALAAAALRPGVTAAQSTPAWDTGKWQFSAVICGYLPKIDGSMAFATASGSPSVTVDASTIVDNLKFTAMY